MKLIHPVTITPSEQPDIRPIGDGTYMLFGDFAVTFLDGANICTLRVPSGTENDGASIPRWLWGLFGLKPDGLHRAAALVHDCLCEYRGFFTNEAMGRAEQYQLSSKETHELFGLLLMASNVPGFRGKMMYKAVRLFGPKWKKRGRY